MDRISSTTERPVSIPRVVRILGGGLFAALAAIVVFNVPLNTVVYYGFIVLMIGSHFFMHGSHGGHAGHEQHGDTSAKADNVADTTQTQDEHAGHSGGCH